MDRALRQDMLPELRRLQSGDVRPHRAFGICYHIVRQLRGKHHVIDVYDELHGLFDEMGLDPEYPVPCPFGRNARYAYQDSHDLWAGEYGEARRKLLDSMINYLEHTL